MDLPPRILLEPALESLDDYEALGGGQGLRRAVEVGATGAIDEITAAGLRGRGGAGFPTGVKWRSVADGGGRHHYAVCNAAEGEPGTFKDRALLRANPYAVLEGLLIGAVAVGAREAFIALKASFEPEIERVRGALGEMEERGWLGDRTVVATTGPEEYLFGEEKALLEVIEGNDPLPRWLPPYLHGLFATAPQLGWQATEPEAGHVGPHEANPTLVNNAESLAHAAWILAHGADEFRAVGTHESPGTIICTVVGDVAEPTVIEVPMGTPLAEVVERAGGAHPGHEVKAVFPGVANAVVPAASLGTPLTYEDMAAAGSGLGAAGFIVYDDSACMVDVTTMISRFLYVESCGQCPPCKLGSGQITEALERIRVGSGTERDLEHIQSRLRMVADGNRCYLPVQEQTVVSSVLRTFPEDFAAHLEGGCLGQPRQIPTPKVVDIADGAAAFDPDQDRKQPDWTYR